MSATSEEAFLRGVLDDPDDDTVRLVYADWLEDVGDPKRAAFVRAQVRLAKLDIDDPARSPLLRDEAEYLPVARASLAAKERPAWLARIPAWAADMLAFERGFPARLTITAERFAKGVEDLFAAAPIQSLRLTVRPAGCFIAPDPLLRRLRALEIEGRAIGQDDESLFASPHLAGLTRLTVRNGSLSPGAVEVMAYSPHLANLRKLDLTGSVRDAGAVALVASPHLGRLESLHLALCDVGEDTVLALATSSLDGLRELDLHWCRISDGAAEALARSSTMPSLRRLVLTSSEPVNTAAAAEALLTGTHRPHLHRFWFRQPEDAAAFWAIQPAEHLRGALRMGVYSEYFDVVQIACSPLLAACRGIVLQCDLITDGGVAYLANSPTLAHLHEFGIQSHAVTVAGVRALARSPHLGKLRRLSLAFARIDAAFVAELLRAPFVQSLEFLDLREHMNRQLDVGCLEMLARSAALEGIETLYLPTHTSGMCPELEARFGGRVVYI